ncbi:MAG: 3-methyl-2-oxobutanoate dehydrogenase subunit VorB [Clostridiales Family XIII bacterium]|jgi:2-oxoglutarate ferredoxin oxidoreductase subunit alpha|nr:3-methyl-2-oxobutanoate dehydrogenase subunit VorB [Clostridiales Family XIII bacterium]
MTDNRQLLKGNEAFAEAAIAAGCRYYFGYPITPQNELTEYMSRVLPSVGGSFVQAESELAAISMAYGAAAAGGRALISSSSPGIALMQEGISFLCSANIPMVLLNVSRGGPGVGGIQPGQADYFLATRVGGIVDYHTLVYAPASIQESINILMQAYETAEKYRNPLMLLVDGMLGQMMEPVVVPDGVETIPTTDLHALNPWAVTGHRGSRERRVIRSLRLKPDELERSIEERGEKYARAEIELTSYEAIDLDGAEIVFVAFGSTSRIVKESLTALKRMRIKGGLIRPITLWPFPYRAFDGIDKRTKAVVSVELSKGQLIQDVKLGVNGRFPVKLIHRTGGMLLTPEEIVAAAKNISEVN